MLSSTAAHFICATLCESFSIAPPPLHSLIVVRIVLCTIVRKYNGLLKLLKRFSPSTEILTLTQDKAALIWYQMCHKHLFRGIEWNSLSAELVDKHCSLFELEEVAKLSSDINGKKEAVTSAMERDAPRVLHAFYQSVCATKTCGGATQHASIAEEIQKRSEFACSCIKHCIFRPVSD